MKFALINELKVTPDLSHIAESKAKDICAGGFLIKNKKFLFGKRAKSKEWAPDLWDIVGGRSLKNEHPMFTLQRETFEETGVKIFDAELLTVGDVASDRDGNPVFRYYIYIIRHFEGKVYNKTKEHTKLKWFSRSELDKVHIALKEYLDLIDAWVARNE